jgi:hypothetical protein
MSEPTLQIGRVLQAADQALSPFVTSNGRAAFPLSAHFVTAKKP